MPSLVRTLLSLSLAALERAIVLLSRLIMLPGAHFAKQVLLQNDTLYGACASLKRSSNLNISMWNVPAWRRALSR